MNTKYLKCALGALAFLLCMSSFQYQVYSASYVTGQVSSSVIGGSMMAGPAAAPLTPARIVISSASVNAQVIPIGVTQTNNLDVPPNFVQTGWYKYGPVPGQIGNAVIDGHVDNAGSTDGPFKHLTSTKVGDEVYVTMSDGSKVTFVVTDASIYLTTQFPSKSVFGGNGQAVLKIITCNGTYKPSMGTYDHRLIVTAVRKA